jgi:hypothetical protein
MRLLTSIRSWDLLQMRSKHLGAPEPFESALASLKVSQGKPCAVSPLRGLSSSFDTFMPWKERCGQVVTAGWLVKKDSSWST